MPYFLSAQNLKPQLEVTISGEEARHLMLSRRLKVGEEIKLQGPDGGRYLCKVLEVAKKDLKVKTLEALSIPQEPKTKVTLFQSYINQSALDLVLQKSTELMASRVVIFNSHNTANRLEKDKFQEKQTRWENILWEAAKQSERQNPPALEFAETLSMAAERAAALDLLVLTEPASNQKLRDLKFENAATIGLFIGPEGGFTPDETAQLLKLPNCKGVNLGPILLRAETASLAALAISLDRAG